MRIITIKKQQTLIIVTHFRLGQKIGIKMQQLHKTMTHLDEGENLQAIIKQDEQMSKLNVATTQNYDPFRWMWKFASNG